MNNQQFDKKERLWDIASMLEFQAKNALEGGKRNIEIDAERIVPKIVEAMREAAGTEAPPSTVSYTRELDESEGDEAPSSTIEPTAGETPRTDALWQVWKPETVHRQVGALYEHSRQLERELEQSRSNFQYWFEVATELRMKAATSSAIGTLKDAPLAELEKANELPDQTAVMRKLISLALRCRPAVAHYMRSSERAAMSPALSACAKDAAEKEAARLGQLLDEMDRISGWPGREVPPHRSASTDGKAA
jgi:hypothetical protein